MFYFYTMVYFLVSMYHLISCHRYKCSFFLLVLVSATSLGLQGLGLKRGGTVMSLTTIPGHVTLTCIYTYMAGETSSPARISTLTPPFKSQQQQLSGA